MSKQRVTLSVLLGVVLLVPGVILAQPARPQSAADLSAPAGSTLFIENTGQWSDAARFQVWGSPAGVGTTWLADDAIWITIVHEPHPSPLSFEERGEGRGLNLKISFPGANSNVRIEPLEPLTTTVSYFLGNDPSHWHPAVPAYSGVRYVDLYPGVTWLLATSAAFGAWRRSRAPRSPRCVCASRGAMPQLCVRAACASALPRATSIWRCRHPELLCRSRQSIGRVRSQPSTYIQMI